MKPGLDELCTRHKIGLYALSGASQLDERATIALLLGFTSTREVIEQVLSAINRITGQSYTLEDVEVSIQDCSSPSLISASDGYGASPDRRGLGVA